jgi:hypothetical protein
MRIIADDRRRLQTIADDCRRLQTIMNSYHIFKINARDEICSYKPVLVTNTTNIVGSVRVDTLVTCGFRFLHAA